MSYNIEDLVCIGNTSDPTYVYFRNISRTLVQYDAQPQYALYTTYYGCALVGIFLLKRILFFIYDHIKPRGHVANIHWKITALCRYVAYMKFPLSVAQYIGMPTSFGTLLALFISALYGLCYLFIPHFWYRQCDTFGSPPLAVRAGLMATALTPFIYILAGKTNVIAQLTGISYERLQIYHQGVAWLTLVFGLVHTFGFVYGEQLNGGWAHLKYNFQTESIYKTGVPPIICLFLLCTLSLPVLRRKYYEVFLHLHWPLGIGYFVTLFVHCERLLSSGNYLYGAIAFWGFQLVYRALIKTSLRPKMSTFITPKDAYLRKIGFASEIFEIIIRNKHMKWEPGQHVFIRFNNMHVLDNHPFSIVSSCGQVGGNDIRLLIKPANGLTRKIYNKLTTEKTQGNSSLFEKIYIDGPYGGMSRDVNLFSNVVLIANGSGVTVITSFLTSMMKFPFSNVKRVHFIWIIRNFEDLEWCADEFSQSFDDARKHGIDLLIDVYVTNDNDSDIDETFKVNVHFGKPNLTHVLDTAYPKHLLRKNVFIVSGCRSVQDTVGNHVSQLQKYVLSGEVEEVYLHTEQFGW